MVRLKKTKRQWRSGIDVGICVLFILLTAPLTLLAKGPGPGGGGGGSNPPTEEAGNNLSFPVIWAEGVSKALPGSAGMEPVLEGEWWYWWGTDAAGNPLACEPDTDDESYCDDGVPLTTGALPGDGYVKAHLQKDILNQWQAASGTPSDFNVEDPVNGLVVDGIDWGDNLESVDWYTNSKVRTEVVLFKDNPLYNSIDPSTAWLEYGMRHVVGLGIDEKHGIAATEDEEGNEVAEIGPGNQATVYSNCARFTIQKLLVDRDDPALADLSWEPGVGWVGEDLINKPIYNSAVYNSGDGPGYYSAEINVKGRIIYGYTWDVRKLNDPAGGTPAGDYRLTFNLDQSCGTASLNTSFIKDVTQILLPVEEETIPEVETLLHDGWQFLSELDPLAQIQAAPLEEETGGGATAVLDCDKNLTFIDVRILERNSGGGGGGKKPNNN